MENRGKLKILIFFSLVIVIFLSSCGKITQPNDIDDAPYGLRITKLLQNKIEISWQYQNTDNDTIEYQLYKQVGIFDEDPNTWIYLARLTNEDITLYQDHINTSDSLIYAYRVRVYKINKKELTHFSDEVAYFSPYSNPTNINVTQTAETNMELTWQDNAVGEEGYAIKKKVGNGDWFTLAENMQIGYFNSIAHYSDTVTPFENVYYKIYAYRGISTSTSLEYNIEPTVMSPDSLSLQKYENAKITLNWQDNSDFEDGFAIEKRVGNLDWNTSYATVDSNVTSYIDDNELIAATISYRVKAVKGTEYSGYSNEASTNILLGLIGEIATPGEAKDLSVQGSWAGVYAYIADMYEGLEIVDCSHPNALISKTINQGITDRIYAVDTKDNVCYFTIHDDPSYNSGFGMIDLTEINEGGYSSIDTLYVIGYSPVPDIPYDVATQGAYSYIASGDNGIVVMISQGPPHVITTLSTNGDARKCVTAGNYLYVANGLNKGIAIIDISNPLAPVLQSNLVLDGYASDIVVSGNYAYLANAENGFVIIDVSDSVNPTVVSQIETGGLITSATVDGNFAYFTDYNNGLYIINVEDKNVPYIQGHVEMDSNPKTVQIYGSYAYVLDNSGLKIIQIDK